MQGENVQYSISLKDLFSNQLKQANANAHQFEGTVNRLKSTIASLGIGIGFGAIIQGIIKTGASFEMAEVQLKTLLKSTTEAKAVFNDLKESATKSPFSFEALLKGNAALISTGISASQAKGDFDALANAIAATGGGEDALQRMTFNLQQIKNVGATTADIKQFGMAGINIYGKLDNYAKKYNVQIDKHHITYEQITGALKLAASAGGDYYNALNNMSETTSGKLSNLSDAFKNFQYDLFNELKPTIDSVVSSLTGMMKWIIKNMDAIKMLARVVRIAVTALVAYKTIMALSVWYTGLSTTAIIANTLVTEGFAAAQVALNIAMAANPIGMVLVALAALAIAVDLVVNNYERLKKQYEVGINSRVANAVEAERTAVQQLADDYKILGESTKDARKHAIEFQSSSLNADIGALKEKIGHSADPEERQRLNMLLTEKMAQHSALGDAGLFDKKGGKSAVGDAKASMAKASGTSSAQGQQHTQITINIKNLIESFTVKTENIQGTAGKMKEEIVKAMLSAVTDAQIIAGT